MAKPLRIPRDALPGRVRPMRPCPADFAARYIELGWDEAQAHYRAGWSVLARWVDEAGGDQLRQARAEHVRRTGPQHLHVVPLERMSA